MKKKVVYTKIYDSAMDHKEVLTTYRAVSISKGKFVCVHEKSGICGSAMAVPFDEIISSHGLLLPNGDEGGLEPWKHHHKFRQ
jgi:hypothetical protein